MAKPESAGSGTLVIPIETFNVWALSFLPPNTFYTLGKPKEKGENIEVKWNASSANVPPEPGEVEVRPA